MRKEINMKYRPVVDFMSTNDIIIELEELWMKKMSMALNLRRVISPSLIEVGSGLQDNLNGEKPVEFYSSAVDKTIQVLQDDCKWRRMFLSNHSFGIGNGILCTLNTAIRKEESVCDNIHSILINNLTWEIVIDEAQRNMTLIENLITKILSVLCDLQDFVQNQYPELKAYISREVSFVSASELEELYPDLSPDERECKYGKEHSSTFCVTQIGYPLKSGLPHGKRTPDYDDWNLNFDILVYYPPLGKSIEIGGGGIRVMKEQLSKQIAFSKWTGNIDTPYHSAILHNKLSPTIGGALGKARIEMILLNKLHIGEVAHSIWDKKTESWFLTNDVAYLK